jgi:hypothetical protein
MWGPFLCETQKFSENCFSKIWISEMDEQQWQQINAKISLLPNEQEAEQLTLLR